MMQLTPEQQQMYLVLKKYIDPVGSRQTGRTLVMAKAVIDTAIENPGTRIMFWDHHGTRQATSILSKYIRYLLNEYTATQRYGFEIRQDSIRFDVERAIEGYHLYIWLEAEKSEREATDESPK